MANSLSSLTAGVGGVQISSVDTSGSLDIKSGTTTIVSITSAGAAITGAVTGTSFGGALNGSLGATTPSTVVATTVTINGSGANIPLEIQSSTGANAIRIKGRVSDGIGTVRFYESTSTTSYGIIQAASTYFALGTEIATPITFQTNATERMRLDSSGNLGLGVTPSAWSANMCAVEAGAWTALVGSTAATSGYTRLMNSSYYNGTNFIYKGTGTSYVPAQYVMTSSGAHEWFTAPSGTAGNAITFTTAMTLNSSGNLLLNVATSNAGGRVYAYGNAGQVTFESNTASGTYYPGWFSVGGTQRGYISTSTSGTTYNTTSDYRLKENVQPMVGALAKVALLKPVTYNWIENKESGQGFIAHELQEVVPECVSGKKDGVMEDGRPFYQGVDTSFLVATLTACNSCAIKP
jgi:hypothetical protein